MPHAPDSATFAAAVAPPPLHTPRLLLRPFRLNDVPDVFAYAGDAEVARTTSWEAHRSPEESRMFLERAIAGYARGERAVWGVEHLGSARLIGTVGLHEINAMHARATLAYALARPFWNQGLTTEAARRALDYGFESLALNRIEAFCLPDNAASARVMSKLGLRFEGTLRERMWLKGAFRDLDFWGILKGEWLAARR